MKTLTALAALTLLTFLPACGPIQTRNTVVIEQPKPLEVNVNLTGRFELVITDARRDLEQITGQKPQRVVNPEDIGLPAYMLPPAPSSPASFPPPASTSTSPASLVPSDSPSIALLASVPSLQQPTPLARQDDLKKQMADRNAQVRALLDTRNAGEAHTGLLSPRGPLTPPQQTLLNAENADRAELYKIEAANKKTTVDQVALSYYLARLGYAQKGDWVEKYNKSTKQWEWIRWQE